MALWHPCLSRRPGRLPGHHLQGQRVAPMTGAREEGASAVPAEDLSLIQVSVSALKPEAGDPGAAVLRGSSGGRGCGSTPLEPSGQLGTPPSAHVSLMEGLEEGGWVFEEDKWKRMSCSRSESEQTASPGLGAEHQESPSPGGVLAAGLRPRLSDGSSKSNGRSGTWRLDGVPGIPGNGCWQRAKCPQWLGRAN